MPFAGQNQFFDAKRTFSVTNCSELVVYSCTRIYCVIFRKKKAKPRKNLQLNDFVFKITFKSGQGIAFG